MTKRVFSMMGISLLVLLLPTVVQSAEPLSYATNQTVTFSGSGTTTTRPFAVDGEWVLQWKAKGFLAVHLYNLKARLNERLMFVYAADGGKGESYHPDPGTYFVNIVASEPWSISIHELKPTKDGKPSP